MGIRILLLQQQQQEQSFSSSCSRKNKNTPFAVGGAKILFLLQQGRQEHTPCSREEQGNCSCSFLCTLAQAKADSASGSKPRCRSKAGLACCRWLTDCEAVVARQTGLQQQMLVYLLQVRQVSMLSAHGSFKLTSATQAAKLRNAHECIDERFRLTCPYPKLPTWQVLVNGVLGIASKPALQTLYSDSVPLGATRSGIQHRLTGWDTSFILRELRAHVLEGDLWTGQLAMTLAG